MRTTGKLATSLWLGVALATSACGNKAQIAPSANGGVDETANAALDAAISTCKSKADCKSATLDVWASFSSSGALIGIIGQPVTWEFYGLDRDSISADQKSSVRLVTVLLDNVPDGSTIDPAPSAGKVAQEAKIEWTPSQAQTGKLDVIVRDMERCLINESADFCNKYAFHADYDQRIKEVQWQVVDKSALDNQVQATAAAAPDPGSTVAASNANCNGQTGTSTSQAFGSGLSSVLGILGGGGLLSQAPSLLGGLMGSGTNATKC